MRAEEISWDVSCPAQSAVSVVTELGCPLFQPGTIWVCIHRCLCWLTHTRSSGEWKKLVFLQKKEQVFWAANSRFMVMECFLVIYLKRELEKPLSVFANINFNQAFGFPDIMLKYSGNLFKFFLGFLSLILSLLCCCLALYFPHQLLV